MMGIALGVVSFRIADLYERFDKGGWKVNLTVGPRGTSVELEQKRDVAGMYIVSSIDLSSEDDASHRGSVHWSGGDFFSVPLGSLVSVLDCVERTAAHLAAGDEFIVDDDDEVDETSVHLAHYTGHFRARGQAA